MESFWNPAGYFPAMLFSYNSPFAPLPYDFQDARHPHPWPLPAPSHYQQSLASVVESDSTSSESEDSDSSGGPRRPLQRWAHRRSQARGFQDASLHGVHGSVQATPFRISSRRQGSSRYPLNNPSAYSAVPTGAMAKPRPSYWRQDYAPPSTPWFRKRLLQLRRFLSEDSRPIERHLVLNLLLHFPYPPPSTFYFDLRCNPFSTYLLHLPSSNGPVNELHWLQLATTPPVHQLRLWHPRLPWTIVVRSTNANGILVSDVLGGLYRQLMMPIVSRDYYNAEMSADDRERIETAYKARCNGDLGMLCGGIRRIDFLELQLGFIGLTKLWNGMWEIRTVDIIDGLPG